MITSAQPIQPLASGDIAQEKLKVRGETILFARNNGPVSVVRFDLRIPDDLLNTNVIGLNPIAIGTLFLFSRIMDGISDPINGYLIDRLPRTKFGKVSLCDDRRYDRMLSQLPAVMVRPGLGHIGQVDDRLYQLPGARFQLRLHGYPEEQFSPRDDRQPQRALQSWGADGTRNHCIRDGRSNYCSPDTVSWRSEF